MRSKAKVYTRERSHHDSVNEKQWERCRQQKKGEHKKVELMHLMKHIEVMRCSTDLVRVHSNDDRCFVPHWPVLFDKGGIELRFDV